MTSITIYFVISIFFIFYFAYFINIVEFYKKSRTFNKACGAVDRPKYDATGYYLSGLRGLFIFITTIFSIIPAYLVFKGFVYSGTIMAFMGFFIFITGVIYSKSNKSLNGIFYKVSIYSPITFTLVTIISLYIEYYKVINV